MSSSFDLSTLLPDNQQLGYLDEPAETQPRSPDDAITEIENLAKAGE